MSDVSSPDPAEPRRLTLDEWANLPEDEEGELVDGILVEEELGGVAHESVVAWLIARLRGWLPAHAGRVLGSEVKIAVAP